MAKRKSIYSHGVIASIQTDVNAQLILNSEIGTDALKHAIAKEAQKANRRVQNILNANVASPAVKALLAERGGRDRFSVFSVAGLDPTNKADWEKLKYEYGRIESFLNNPTSTATGAKQYVRYQAKRFGIDYELANELVDMATEPEIDEHGNINVFNYKIFLDALHSDLMKVQKEMKRDKESYAKYLEQSLRSAIAQLTKLEDTEINNFLKRFF